MVALLTAAMLVPSVGGAMGSAAAQALFFARIGVEYLPPMYMALGAVTSLTSLLVTALLGRLPKRRLYLLLPVCLALLLVLSRVLTALDLRWVYPALWLEMNLFWTLQAFRGGGGGGGAVRPPPGPAAVPALRRRRDRGRHRRRTAHPAAGGGNRLREPAAGFGRAPCPRGRGGA